MPSVSLVVCAHEQIDLLQRLLSHSESSFDDLVVVHDGSPDAGDERVAANDYSVIHPDSPLPAGYSGGNPTPAVESIQALVEKHGGRYFEGPRCYQQEPHWPFAWSQAKHDWILRLDADEFPSSELASWLRQFRASPEPEAEISGYTCIWPLWNGTRTTASHWPAGRTFLINRRRTRFIGMVEESPIADGRFAALPLVLHHQPKRKSYGFRNVLLRRQSYRWRRVIAQSLMAKPTDLPCWRWITPAWPEPWNGIRRHPLKHSVSALIRYPLRQLISMIKAGLAPNLSAALNPGLHHFMLGLRVWSEKRRHQMTTP